MAWLKLVQSNKCKALVFYTKKFFMMGIKAVKSHLQGEKQNRQGNLETDARYKFCFTLVRATKQKKLSVLAQLFQTLSNCCWFMFLFSSVSYCS